MTEPTEAIIDLDTLCERLRTIVLGGRNSCLNGTPMVPLHIATVTSIYQHLEDARAAIRTGNHYGKDPTHG